MLDVSDGLSSELFHICKQSNVGCMVYEEKVPIEEVTFNQAVDFGIDPITCALSGGDEYELLFTVHQDDLETVTTLPGISHIGNIVSAESGKKLTTTGGNIHDLTALGWQHF